MSLSSKVILITGASRGIGRATAILAAEQGAKVAINYFQATEQAEELLQELSQKTQAILVQGDVSDYAQAQQIITKTEESLGPINILINNAGVLSVGALEQEEITDLDRIIDVNLKGTLNMIHAVLPAMKQRSDGIIVNISSDAGKTGYANLATYCATKFAILGLTESLGLELKASNIRVYAVCPGGVDTDMIKGLGFQGMPPEKVATRVLEAASETLKLESGDNTEIFT